MLILCIRNFWKTNSLVLSLLLLLQIVSVISLQYTYFDYRQTVSDRYIYAGNAASFMVTFEKARSFTELKEIIEKLRVREAKSLDCIYVSLDKEDTLRAYMFGQNYIVHYGKNFSAVNEAVISAKTMESENLQIGNSVTFGNRQYKITGIRLESYDEIPYASLDGGTFLYAVHFRLSKLPVNSEITEFSQTLRTACGAAAVISNPTDRDYNTEYGINSGLLSTCLLFCLSLLNISFIFKFLIQKRKKIYTVSRLCGALSVRLFFLLLVEAAIYLLFAVILGSAVFRLFVIPAAFSGYRYGYEDFIPPSLLYLMFSLIAFVPPLVTFSRSTPIELRQR